MPDENLAARLAAAHQAVVEGEVDLPTTGTGASTADARVERAAELFRVLERARQDTPVPGADASSVSDDPPRALETDLELPRRIGRFQIRRELGQGGFGLVLLAFDPELERDVALKVPRVETLVDDESRERFVREARMVASVNHPHIATVYESGRVGPICYIASAYYPGGSLADVVRQHAPFQAANAARIVAALAQAVQHAHSRGILHRDLKPANVLLDSAPTESAAESDDGLAGRVRVTDFGLARASDDPTHRTRTGALVGTPAYMSPEQADSRLDEISTASDIYALGAILYELLTGHPPFRADTALAVLQAVRNDEPPPPRRQNPSIPRDLEAVCLKCLHKRPDRRYPTANALAADLHRWLAGHAVEARPVTTLQRLGRWTRRNPALTAASVVAALALVAGSTVSTALWLRAERNAGETAARAEELATALDNLQAAIDGLFVTVAESPELKRHDAEPLRRKLLDQAGRYYELLIKERPDDPHLVQTYAETLFRLGIVHKQLGDAADAERIIRKALDELRGAPESPGAFWNDVEWNRRLAHVLDQLGRPADARAVQMDAIRRTETVSAAPGHDELQRVLALLWADVAGGELVASNLRRAREAAEKSYAIWAQLPPSPGVHASADEVLARATCSWVLGIALEETGRLAEAERHLRDAVELLESADDLTEDMTLLLGRAYKKLGIAVAKQERLQEAQAIYGRGLECVATLCERHPGVPEYRMEWCSTRYSLSYTEYLLGNHDRTIELLEENVVTYAALVDAHPDRRIDYLNRQGVGWNAIAAVHQQHGRLAEASAAVEKAMVCYRTVEQARPDWSFNQVVLAECELNLGHLLRKQDAPDAARVQYASAGDRLRPIVAGQPDHQRARRALYGVHNSLADTAFDAGRFDEAALENTAALELIQDVFAWQATLRQAQLLSQRGEFQPGLQVLREFLNGGTNKQEHAIAVARIAAQLHQSIPDDQTDLRDAARRLVTQAVQRARPAGEPERTAFRDELSADALLAPFIGEVNQDDSQEPIKDQ